MNKPERAQTAEQEPDFYSNTSFMVGEIVLAHRILDRKIKNLRSQNQAKTAVGQKLAAEEISKLADQLKHCSDFIARKSTEFLNRRPR